MFALKILIIISIIITIGIMFGGAFSMTRVNNDGRKSNMLMRYRVLSQFITVLLIALYLWLNN
ncbi:MAG: HIG1 domain-containing protein [Proteobacteria bacterium]|nr:HIG1 domain-containing protein [Pseudomonadota bacterium]